MDRSACMEEARAEQCLHMSFELGFAAMRVILRNLRGDALMDVMADKNGMGYQIDRNVNTFTLNPVDCLFYSREKQKHCGQYF